MTKPMTNAKPKKKATPARKPKAKAKVPNGFEVSAIGRPSEYDPAFCEAVIAAGAQGYSLTAFAGLIGVHRDTLYAWGEAHPEFSDAMKRHKAVRVHRLEFGLLNSASAPVVTAHIFALKNACPEEWRDKVVQEHTGPNGGPVQISEIRRTIVDPKHNA